MLELGMTLPGLRQRAGAVGALPALGLLTLAGMTPGGWEVSYHEASAATPELVAAVVATRPTLVGISALTASIVEAYALADALRAEGLRVVIGGLHASVETSEATGHADAVVVGDGEPVWLEVLEDARRGRLRAVYRPERPMDLAAAPLPRFGLLGGKERPRYTVQTSRGCPLACDFCGASRLLGPHRVKPPAVVARELAAVAEVRPRATIELADDNTFVARKDAVELLGVLERSGVRYLTEADWRIGERPEVLDRLADSGCVQVLVGVEALRVREAAWGGMGAKAAPLGRVLDALEAVQRAGVAVIACFVVGGDGEDFESMAALGEFLVGGPFADVQLTVQTPFPGTALRARLGREGRLLPERGWESCTLFDVAYRPDRLSVGELESGFRSLVKMVFAEGPARRREQIRREVWGRRYAEAV